MIFFKHTLFFLILLGNAVSLYAMEHNQKVANLLKVYPVPNSANSWFMHVLGCNQPRTEAHNRVVKRAQRKHDPLKVEVCNYVYDGYLQNPFSLWCSGQSVKRERRGKKLFYVAVEAQRDDLALLLLAHLASSNHYELMRLAVNSVRPREMITLLQDCGVEIDALNSNGYTLLGSLARVGNRAQVATLLSCGADVNRGYSPLPEIYQRNRVKSQEMISLLLAHGAAIDARDGTLDIDELNQVHEGTVFYHAIKSGDYFALRRFLRNALFEPSTTEISQRQKRVFIALCLFKRLHLARDIQFLLLSYMPEEVSTQQHAAWLLSKGISLERLVPHCRFSWLRQMYQGAEQVQRSQLFETLVPLLVQHRMGKVTKLLSSNWLLDEYCLNVFGYRLKRADIKPEVVAVLHPSQVTQHRAGIEQNVRNALV